MDVVNTLCEKTLPTATDNECDTCYCLHSQEVSNTNRVRFQMMHCGSHSFLSWRWCDSWWNSLLKLDIITMHLLWSRICLVESPGFDHFCIVSVGIWLRRLRSKLTRTTERRQRHWWRSLCHVGIDRYNVLLWVILYNIRKRAVFMGVWVLGWWWWPYEFSWRLNANANAIQPPANNHVITLWNNRHCKVGRPLGPGKESTSSFKIMLSENDYLEQIGIGTIRWKWSSSSTLTYHMDSAERLWRL